MRSEEYKRVLKWRYWRQAKIIKPRIIYRFGKLTFDYASFVKYGPLIDPKTNVFATVGWKKKCLS